VRPSRRLVAAGAVAAAAAFVACGLAVASQGAGRAVLATATLALAIGAGARFLLGLGRKSVVRFTWDRMGRWHLQLAGGRRISARLADASTLCGPWTLLAWTGESGGRYHAVVDAAVVGRREYATLRSRLRLERL
jgi:hypothetical protein